MNMEYRDIINEAKENTPKLSGPTGYTQGALILMVYELRRLNENIEKLTKRVQSDLI